MLICFIMMKTFRSLLIATLTISSVISATAQSKKAPVRESIEWLDVWLPNTNDSGLPRILLIGNSITRGYYPEVQKALAGKAYVARLTTSKSVGDPGLLDEISLILSYHKFDVVHFNNGLHGWGYTEQEFAQAFPGFVNTIRSKAPSAKLMWATITPIRDHADLHNFDARTERIKTRNKMALEFIAMQKDILVDDLWTFTINKYELFEG